MAGKASDNASMALHYCITWKATTSRTWILPRYWGNRQQSVRVVSVVVGFAADVIDSQCQTVETMLVQMFVEAKRHQPSVLYIPGLTQWAAALSPTARATFSTLLDSLTPSEPVIIIALMDEPLTELDDDLSSWFGRMGENLIGLRPPSQVRYLVTSGNIFIHTDPLLLH